MPRELCDPRITVRPSENMKEYQRQYNYLRRYPDVPAIPPPLPNGEKRKERIANRSDPRITANWVDDRKEYMRQKKYIQLHPDCTEVPPKRGTTVPTWLITVERKEDYLGWQRQYQFLRKNPDADYIPMDIIDPPLLVKEKNIEKGRDDGKSGTGHTGAKHKDPRITVRRCEDPVEYKRQLGYLRAHPDCKEIAPRQRVNHRKNRTVYRR